MGAAVFRKYNLPHMLTYQLNNKEDETTTFGSDLPGFVGVMMG